MIAGRVVPIGDGSGFAISDRLVLTAAHVIKHSGNRVKDLRSTIGELSEYREIIVDDESRVAVLVREQSSDSPDLALSLDSPLQCLGFLPVRTNDVLSAQERGVVFKVTNRHDRLDTRPGLLPPIKNSACSALQSSPSHSALTDYLPAGMASSPAHRALWSPSLYFTSTLGGLSVSTPSYVNGDRCGIIAPELSCQGGRFEFRGLASARLLVKISTDVLATTSRPALLRFIDGILAALRLMLVLVLTALSQQLDAPAFVLVMLAVCLRYGRREKPDDHAFLPMRRNRTSLGWCPQG